MPLLRAFYFKNFYTCPRCICQMEHYVNDKRLYMSYANFIRLYVLLGTHLRKS